MKRTTLKILLLAVACLFLNGCGKSSNEYSEAMEALSKQPPDTDVTKSPEYNFSTFAGTVWETKTKTALADVTEYTGVHNIYLLAPKHFDPTQPDYTTGNDTKILYVHPPGVRLRIGQLIKDNGIGSIIWVTGIIQDGTNAPKSVYLDFSLLSKNRFISNGGSSSTNWGVNSNLLEAVTNAP